MVFELEITKFAETVSQENFQLFSAQVFYCQWLILSPQITNVHKVNDKIIVFDRAWNSSFRYHKVLRSSINRVFRSEPAQVCTGRVRWFWFHWFTKTSNSPAMDVYVIGSERKFSGGLCCLPGFRFSAFHLCLQYVFLCFLWHVRSFDLQCTVFHSVQGLVPQASPEVPRAKI